MSAVNAAKALLECDTHIYEFAYRLSDDRSGDKKNLVIEFMRGYLAGTWTLTLAARAANVTEQQVIAALLRLEPFRLGSARVCREEAALLFGEL